MPFSSFVPKYPKYEFYINQNIINIQLVDEKAFLNSLAGNFAVLDKKPHLKNEHMARPYNSLAPVCLLLYLRTILKMK